MKKYWQGEGTKVKASRKELYYRLAFGTLFFIELLQIIYSIISTITISDVHVDIYQKGLGKIGEVYIVDPDSYSASSGYRISQVVLSIGSFAWTFFIGYRIIFQRSGVSILFFVVPTILSLGYVISALPQMFETTKYIDEFIRDQGFNPVNSSYKYDLADFIYFNEFYFQLSFVLAIGIGCTGFAIANKMSSGMGSMHVK